MKRENIQVLQSYYEELSKVLLALLRSGLLMEGSQELHEAKLNYDRWLAKSHVLKLVLNGETLESEKSVCPSCESNQYINNGDEFNYCCKCGQRWTKMDKLDFGANVIVH